MRPLRALALPLLVAGCIPFDAEAYPTVYEQTCAEASCLEDFVFTDATKWRMREGDHAPALELVGRSDYRPPHRSPLSIALIEGVEVQDFDLDVDLLQTGRNYGHRDLCLFFGVQSKSRFSYTLNRVPVAGRKTSQRCVKQTRSAHEERYLCVRVCVCECEGGGTHLVSVSEDVWDVRDGEGVPESEGVSVLLREGESERVAEALGEEVAECVCV